MAQYGYLGDNYGSEYDPDYDGDRNERGRRGDDRARRSDFMFDDRGRGWGDDERSRPDRHRDDQGFLAEARSWFRDDEREDRRDRGNPSRGESSEWFGGRAPRDMSQRPQGGERQRFSSHPDDHYRSWRDKQLQALDRDYQDYCREREQQFHQDFDSWRQGRQQQGSAQRNMADRTPEHDDTRINAGETQGTSSPTATATLGTNDSENTTAGRGRR